MENLDQNDPLWSETKENTAGKNKAPTLDGNNEMLTANDSDPNRALEALTDRPDTPHSTPSLRRSSSTDTARRVVLQPTKVHFAASPNIGALSKAAEQYVPSFRNPFSEDLEAQSRRTSVSSQISDTALPKCLATHRDTFARLLGDADDVEDDEDHGSCYDTPTQAGYMLFHRRPFHLR